MTESELIKQLEQCLETTDRALKTAKRHMKNNGVKKFHVQLILNSNQIRAMVEEFKKIGETNGHS